MQGLAEITFQLRHGMATESHYVNFVYRAAWFPVPWAGCLFSCLGFGGFATQHIFVSEPFLALEGCLASFHFHNSDESHRSFQGTRGGDLWGPSLYHWKATGGWVSSGKSPLFLEAFSFAEEEDVVTECGIDLPVPHFQVRAYSH